MSSVDGLNMSHEQFYSNNISNLEAYVKLINKGNFQARIEILYFSGICQNKKLNSEILSTNESKSITIPSDASNIYVSIQYYNAFNTWVEVKYEAFNVPTNVCFQIYGDVEKVVCDEMDCNTQSNNLVGVVGGISSDCAFVRLTNKGEYITQLYISATRKNTTNKFVNEIIVYTGKTEAIIIPQDVGEVYVEIRYADVLGQWKLLMEYLFKDNKLREYYVVGGTLINPTFKKIDNSTTNANTLMETTDTLSPIVGDTVSNEATGYLSLVNTSSFTSRLSISYRIPGKRFKNFETIKISSNKSGKINYPTNSYDISIKIEVSSFISSWKTIYDKSFNYFDNRCFKVSGGVISSVTAMLISCNSTPLLSSPINNPNNIGINDNNCTCYDNLNMDDAYLRIKNSTNFVIKIKVSYEQQNALAPITRIMRIMPQKIKNIYMNKNIYNLNINFDFDNNGNWETIDIAELKFKINQCYEIFRNMNTNDILINPIECNIIDSINNILEVGNNSDSGYIKLRNNGVFLSRLYIRYQLKGYIGTLEKTVTLASTQVKQIPFPAETTNVYVEFQVANVIGQFKKVDYRQYSYVVKKCFSISGSITNAKVVEISCN